MHTLTFAIAEEIIQYTQYTPPAVTSNINMPSHLLQINYCPRSIQTFGAVIYNSSSHGEETQVKVLNIEESLRERGGTGEGRGGRVSGTLGPILLMANIFCSRASCSSM